VNGARPSAILRKNRAGPRGAFNPKDHAAATSRALRIVVDSRTALDADVALPARTRGLVIFAHGSGSSRKSPRNLHVANRLHLAGFGTLLFDLLTATEQRRDEVTAEHRFDVPLLASRLLAVARAIASDATLPGWRGYFGASTGAAAALVAAAADPAIVGAVVSRGGRPDLAAAALGGVHTPTLLIVGGEDHEVLELNERAYDRLHCVKRLAVVPGATHLFEEPGALDEACDHAVGWFEQHCPVGTDGMSERPPNHPRSPP
jgi:dienelactone hydrolase